MRAHRLTGIATACAVGLALAMWHGNGLVLAQSASDASPGAAQSTPPGFIVTPPRPLPPQPDARHRSPGITAPDDRSAPDDEPRAGGCRFQEQKLELIV